jgi:hypothetical protein
MPDLTVTLTYREDDVYVAMWHQRRYRFMFSDGTTADVQSHADSSTLRAALLDLLGKERIEGVADLSSPSPPATAGTKRRRKAAPE